ncbi:MAG: repressor LexA [Proteobacteria bacterium]|nr:repressor LexA [Pseudomonadota bacterium]
MPRLPRHGGRRPGAGRKPGTGLYGEPTTNLRIPQSRVATVRTFLDQCRQGKRASLPAANDELLLPLIGRVAAGQPIDADAHVEREIAIDRFLFRPRPDYLLRVHGHSMRDAGILDRDLIAVHRTPEARNGQIVVARLDGEITVKRLARSRNRIVLLPENPDFEPIEVHADDFAIEGIYVGVIRVP